MHAHTVAETSFGIDIIMRTPDPSERLPQAHTGKPLRSLRHPGGKITTILFSCEAPWPLTFKVTRRPRQRLEPLKAFDTSFVEPSGRGHDCVRSARVPNLNFYSADIKQRGSMG